jgi:hypothetical protein
MSELSKALRSSGRTPAFDVLCKAFQKFFEARAEEPGVITEFHARQLVKTYKYLRANHNEQDADNSAAWKKINSGETSELVLYVLSHATCHSNSHPLVRELAQNAYNNLSAASVGELIYEAVLAWVRILAFYGSPYQAHQVLITWWPKLQSWPELDAQGSPWLWVLHGLALKQDSFNVERLVRKTSTRGYFHLSPQHQEDLILGLLEQNQVDAAKVIYTCPLPEQAEPTIAAMVAIARASVLNNDVTWAYDVLHQHLPFPRRETRDVLLLVEAARGSRGRALAQTMETWLAKDPSIRDGMSVSCVNDLIKYANVVGDPQLAAEYARLIPEWNLESDLDTLFLLELEACIQASDVNGTVKILRDLEQNDDASTSISASMRSRLIQTLCQWPNNDDAFDQVTNLLDPVVHHGTHLDASTLASLTHLLAHRHDWEALSQLLRPRLNTYSLSERPLLRDPLLTFIHDHAQPPEQVWEAYQLTRIAFPDTPSDTRIAIMHTFFDRGMLDQAVQVFGHMRHANSALQRPTAEAYITCFLGLTRAADWANIKLIRNMLKLDVDVEMSTRVRNAVMLALAACHRVDEALTEFSEILRSDEGPSQNTLVIFFRVCESPAHANGAASAEKMMRKIAALEIPLDERLWLAYVKAVAAQGEHELAIEALDRSEEKIGLAVDKDMYVP